MGNWYRHAIQHRVPDLGQGLNRRSKGFQVESSLPTPKKPGEVQKRVTAFMGGTPLHAAV